MFEFLIALSGGLGVIAAALGVVFGHRGDTYKSFGYVEEAAKSYKIMWYCYAYIFLWLAAAIIIPVFFCK
jgi:hypothetical protein